MLTFEDLLCLDRVKRGLQYAHLSMADIYKIMKLKGFHLVTIDEDVVKLSPSGAAVLKIMEGALELINAED